MLGPDSSCAQAGTPAGCSTASGASYSPPLFTYSEEDSRGQKWQHQAGASTLIKVWASANDTLVHTLFAAWHADLDMSVTTEQQVQLHSEGAQQ